MGGGLVDHAFAIGERGDQGLQGPVTRGSSDGAWRAASLRRLRHQGGQLFFSTLLTYLAHSAGRAGTPVTAFGPPVDDWPAAWAALPRELGCAVLEFLRD
jgi:hypothetical protein